MGSIHDFFSEEEKTSIKEAIFQAETNTSGEIRVHIEKTCRRNVLDRAAEVFHMLKMDQTELRNGVLFYVAVKSHHFAIIGDEGLNAVVPENFWEEIKDIMESHFKADEFAIGLKKGIDLAGMSIKKHFPYQSDDVNELSDEISFGKNN